MVLKELICCSADMGTIQIFDDGENVTVETIDASNCKWDHCREMLIFNQRSFEDVACEYCIDCRHIEQKTDERPIIRDILKTIGDCIDAIQAALREGSLLYSALIYIGKFMIVLFFLALWFVLPIIPDYLFMDIILILIERLIEIFQILPV